MLKKLELRPLSFVIVCAICIASLISCDDDNSNSNNNTNSSTNGNPNNNSNSSTNSSTKDLSPHSNGESVVESTVFGVCRVYADKLVLFCDSKNRNLTDWHLNAWNDKDLFMTTCVAHEFFKDMTADKLKFLEDDANTASNCGEVLDLF